MNVQSELLQLAECHNGTITSLLASQEGYNSSLLNAMEKQGKLDRVTRGVYVLPEEFEDSFYAAQYRYPRGIFSQLSALYLYELTDLTPEKHYMTFPFGYNTTKPKNYGVICNSATQQYYSLEIKQVETPLGNSVRCYSAEKTLCDILRGRSCAYTGVIGDAYRNYFRREHPDPGKIMALAEILHVRDRVQPFLEVFA